MMLLDLTGTGISGRELETRLESVGIIANKNAVPNDPRPPFETSGMRFGTPAATTRGFGGEEMRLVGDLIVRAVTDFDESKALIKEKTAELCRRFPIYP